MHAEKARLFDDDAMADRISRCDAPHEYKMMGGRVAGFVGETWDVQNPANWQGQNRLGKVLI